VDKILQDKFLQLWQKHFPGAELPIGFYYTNEPGETEIKPAPPGHHCVMGELAQVRQGTPLCCHKNSLGCSGGKRYLGFDLELMPNFEYFLSCGIPGQLEGERYKKSPELVKKFLENTPPFEAPADYLVWKRWDQFAEGENPEVVVFFAGADILSGLFTLANFDEVDSQAVITPFAAGCGSIVLYPYLEGKSPNPHAVLGMFDVSARPFVTEQMLSFAVPMGKFLRMLDNMEESFLMTGSWEKIKRRMIKSVLHENQ
jgi:hypothetical protein